MPVRSDKKIPITISEAPPAGAPATVNTVADVNANQLNVRILATGADVTLGLTTLWYYDPEDGRWGPAARNWKNGVTVIDGTMEPDLLRYPVGATAFHLESAGIVNLGNASGDVQPIRDGA